MDGIYVREVTVQNYKCFDSHALQLVAPDGATRGSGLNVLIGENGTGKTALLEAINYASQSSYAAENRLQVSDFNDYKKPIRIGLSTNDFKCKMSAPYMGCTFDCNGIEFQARNRDKKSGGKLLSAPFSISSSYKTKRSTYQRQSGEDSGKPVPALNRLVSNSSIDGSDFNIYYFDKNRTRQLSTGTFKTTFDRICDDLNWKFLREIEDADAKELLANIEGEFFSNVLALSQKSAGKKLASEMVDFFGDAQYGDLHIDLVDLLHPFSNAFFSVRKEGSLIQVRPRALGSGVEMILTLLLLRGMASEAKGGIIYLLDEPELHLHPKAQQGLAALLLDEAANKQIIVSTHSPYLLRNFMDPSVNKVVLRRDSNGRITIESAGATHWGIFPWSPSWGEVNFVAYDLATVDYHNELYGWLQEHHGLIGEDGIERFLVGRGVPKNKIWQRSKGGKAEPPYDVTLCTYVRNSIHHPENPLNPRYTESELKESVIALRKVV